MATGLYGKPLAFNPTLTSASEIFGVFPNGPQITMRLKVKEIGPVNKQQTQYGNRQHCIYTLCGQDDHITIRADCWQDHIQTCLSALPVGAMFSISFCPKPLPQQLIAPIIPWGIRLNTECQICDIPAETGARMAQGGYGQQPPPPSCFYPAQGPPQGDRFFGNPPAGMSIAQGFNHYPEAATIPNPGSASQGPAEADVPQPVAARQFPAIDNDATPQQQQQ